MCVFDLADYMGISYVRRTLFLPICNLFCLTGDRKRILILLVAFWVTLSDCTTTARLFVLPHSPKLLLLPLILSKSCYLYSNTMFHDNGRA